jgi:hypothetical protein
MTKNFDRNKFGLNILKHFFTVHNNCSQLIFSSVVRRLVLWGALELASPLSPSPSSGITGLNMLTAINQGLIMHQRTKLAEKCSLANGFCFLKE